MPDGLEIERKWLPSKKPSDLETYPSKELEQFYICMHPVLRARHEGDEYIFTYKGSGGLSRTEYNLPLNEEAYISLYNKREGSVITKTRYYIPASDGLTVEFDVFHGDYEGVLVAEVEFENLSQSEAFKAPEWLGTEVTGNPSYSNAAMASGRFPQFRTIQKMQKNRERIYI